MLPIRILCGIESINKINSVELWGWGWYCVGKQQNNQIHEYQHVQITKMGVFCHPVHYETINFVAIFHLICITTSDCY